MSDLSARSDAAGGSAAEEILAALCRAHGFVLAQLWIPNSEGTHFTCAAAWHSDDDTHRFFHQACREIRLSVSSTVLGQCMRDETSVWRPSISEEPDFQRSDLTRAAGYQAFLCVPLFVDHNTFAVVEFYDVRRRAPEPDVEADCAHRLQAAREKIIGAALHAHLLQQESTLTDAEHLAHMGRWNWDLVHDRLDWSDELFRIFGISREEFGGRSKDFFMRLHENDRTRFRSFISAELAGKRHGFTSEERIVRPEGEVRTLQTTATILRDEKGRAIRVTGLCLDITERRTAEAERLRHEEKYRMLFRNAPVGIVITDENDTIIEVNERFREMFGFEDADPTGKNYHVLLHPDTPAAEMPLYQELRQGRLRSLQMEKRFHINGRALHASIHLAGMTLQEHGEPAWYCVRMLEDVSEEQELQEQLMRAEKRRAGELQQFAFRVQTAQEEERRRIALDLHDDYCQRLSGMKLSVEVVEDEMRTGRQGVQEKLQLLKAQLEGMIDDIRRMSHSLRPSVLDDFGLAPALRVMGEEYHDMHGIAVDLRMDGYDSVPALRTHETALYRIVQEALSNVVRHAEARSVHVEIATGADQIRLRIRDDGRGFNPSAVQYVEGDLHGLGLVSMRERAEQLRGSFHVDSSPGAGTSIQVILPLPTQIQGEE